MNNVTRREFLVDSAVLAGGAIGTLTLGSGLLFPQTGHAEKVEFPESSCGVEKGINHKVLVAYASRCGSTGEVAEAIGQVFLRQWSGCRHAFGGKRVRLELISGHRYRQCYSQQQVVARGYKVCGEKPKGIESDACGFLSDLSDPVQTY